MRASRQSHAARTDRARSNTAGTGSVRAADKPRAVSAQNWLGSHARCLIESLGRLHRRWLASLLTALVIGIALALPTGLYVLVDNLQSLSDGWQRAAQASLYLADGTSTADGRALADRIAAQDDVESTRFVSADEGLADFRQASGFGTALDALADNPLPAVIVITPRPGLPKAAVSELVERLGHDSMVARAELDQAWLSRLYAIVSLIQRAAWVIGLLLSAAVLFIVGNTIRLDIENRREEIEVMKLLGASDAFIRRPFLYSGFWYGLIGAVFALILLAGCFIGLTGPLSELVRSYDGALSIHGLGFLGVLSVLAVGIGLGWIGCVITVNRRLADIEPK
ncbi:permease-like cell division protein FtsX [Salinisphaera sp. T31B1]|uniref:permease-like cell division protein FtsX n=1 Tax=Salinisphaera sp. T31B1 TaxID=727963 RepID=UPI00334238C2